MKKTALMFAAGLISSAAIGHTVDVSLGQFVGSVKYPVYVTSTNAVRLYNGRDYPVSYSYHYRLCIDSVKDCRQIDRNIRLPAHSGTPEGAWTNVEQLVLENVFDYPGNYQVQSTTWIEGDGETSKTAHSVISIR